MNIVLVYIKSKEKETDIVLVSIRYLQEGASMISS